MKIDPENVSRFGRETTPVTGASGGGRVSGGNAAATGRSAGSSGPRDGLALSSDGERFRQLRARLADLPEPSRPERVEALRAAIASGTYAVDGDRIAQALLEDEPTASLLGIRQGR